MPTELPVVGDFSFGWAGIHLNFVYHLLAIRNLLPFERKRLLASMDGDQATRSVAHWMFGRLEQL